MREKRRRKGYEPIGKVLFQEKLREKTARKKCLNCEIVRPISDFHRKNSLEAGLPNYEKCHMENMWN